VRNHQQWHVENRDDVGGGQPPTGVRRKADLDRVVIGEDEIARPHEIEGDDGRPKERTYPRTVRGAGETAWHREMIASIL